MPRIFTHKLVLKGKMAPVLRRLAAFSANAVLIIIVLPIFYLVEPFWRIRITHFGVDRIGHIAGELQLCLARNLLGKDRPVRTTHILLAGNSCNQQLLDMWKRRLPIFDNYLASFVWHSCKYILRKTRFDDPKKLRYDAFQEFDFKQAHLSFTEDENSRGQKLLNKMGIGPSEWFVAFSVRDRAFAQSRFPHLNAAQVDRKAGFRNADIGNYLKAAQVITDRGGFAVRMGAVVSNALVTDNSRIIDYATCHRSDFGDIYLSGKCRFFLSGGSGLSAVPVTFGLPVASPNLIPIFPLFYGKHSLYTPMFLRKRNSGELMAFDEALEYGMFDTAYGKLWNTLTQYEEIGVSLEHNTPDDIADLCHDMFDRLEGTPPPEGSEELQRLFKKRFLSQIVNHEYAPDIGPRYALKYRDLIEG
jgi:putative glycosyltransferase (TIGR04372 family)